MILLICNNLSAVDAWRVTLYSMFCSRSVFVIKSRIYLFLLFMFFISLMDSFCPILSKFGPSYPFLTVGVTDPLFIKNWMLFLLCTYKMLLILLSSFIWFYLLIPTLGSDLDLLLLVELENEESVFTESDDLTDSSSITSN